MKIKLLFCLSFLFLSSIVLAQHENIEHEISGNVPELHDMHKIIYPIWHKAYPEKDYQALKSFVKEVNEKAEKVYLAKLPGILREKKVKWDEGIEELKGAVQTYNEAASKDNNEQLLNAAEVLHSKYEMLVRIIRPVVKELDEFHKTLYVVYHKDLPGKDYPAIKSKTEEFVIKAEAVTKASLPKRLEKRKEHFDKAAGDLLKASIELRAKVESDQPAAIDSAVNKLHSRYQIVERVFE